MLRGLHCGSAASILIEEWLAVWLADVKPDVNDYPVGSQGDRM
jgi:hypothetical protein